MVEMRGMRRTTVRILLEEVAKVVGRASQKIVPASFSVRRQLVPRLRAEETADTAMH
jgi:aminoglycoside N3'-acetyltransferase